MELDPAILFALAALVTALVQAARTIPGLAERTYWLPFLAIAVGLLLAAPVALLWGPAGLAGLKLAAWAALHGLAAGLAACGLYSAAGRYVLPGSD